MPVHCCIRCKTKGPDLKKRSFSWRAITSWAMLDFSNSTVLMVLLGQYVTFIANYLYEREQSQLASDRVMYANIVISVLTLVISPPLGALIDSHFIRIPVVIVSIICYSVASMVLYAVDKSTLILPIAMYAVGTLFFRVNEMVCSAFLPSLCNDRDMGFVSSYGYFIGFISGIVITLITKLFTTPPAGTLDTRQYTINGYKTTMMIVGIIQLLSGVPPMLTLDNGIPEGERRPKVTKHIISDSFKANAKTIRESFKVNRTLTLVLLCYLLFSVGAQSYISFGPIYMLRVSLPEGFTINSFQDAGLAYNCIVGVSSLIYGIISRRISAFWLVIFTFSMIVVGTSVGFWWLSLPGPATGTSFKRAFFYVWFTMMFYAFSIGPVQALIRGVVGVLTPEEKKAELFGCLESMIIFGSVLGSIIPGQLIGLNNWNGVAFYSWIMVFFVLSFIMWCFIPIRKEEQKAVEKMRLKELEKEGRLEGVDAIKTKGDDNVLVSAELKVDVKQGESSDSSASSSAPSSSSSKSSSATVSSSSDAQSARTVSSSDARKSVGLSRSD